MDHGGGVTIYIYIYIYNIISPQTLRRLLNFRGSSAPWVSEEEKMGSEWCFRFRVLGFRV